MEEEQQKQSCLCDLLSSTQENTGSFAAATLKLKTPTCLMPLWGCRILDTFCLHNSVPSCLFTYAHPVTDLETAAVHLKVTPCVLKEINKQKGILPSICINFACHFLRNPPSAFASCNPFMSEPDLGWKFHPLGIYLPLQDHLNSAGRLGTLDCPAILVPIMVS